MKRVLALLIIMTTLGAATVAFTQSFNVQLGKTRGPEQPLPFSHRRHAGDMAIDCLYCHNGADKSPVANIPPMSTCMGCHKIVSTSKPTIKALTGYWDRKEQIPWVEVYRLPDYVKFNHKRHVMAGVQCETCHGPVQQMDVVYQFPSLKMGWCVGCHRTNLDAPQFQATMDCITCHH